MAVRFRLLWCSILLILKPTLRHETQFGGIWRHLGTLVPELRWNVQEWMVAQGVCSYRSRDGVGRWWVHKFRYCGNSRTQIGQNAFKQWLPGIG